MGCGILGLTDTLTDLIDPVNTWVWYAAFVFLIGLGILFTIKLKGLQILKIRETSKLALSGTNEGKHKSTVSSFEAFCIGLGARVGVGNIAGTAGAIAVGGPGAIFWMWVFAIIGSATSFMESTLSQLFKEKKSDGGYHSGPAYYALKGLNKKWVANLAAILIIITFGIGFVGVQASNSVDALTSAFDLEDYTIVFAAIIAIVAALIIFGGMKRIAVFSSKVVPAMAILWIVFCGITICLNYDGIINAFVMIFSYAFDAESIAGGLFGAVIIQGLKRGVFSNEAGLGSIANIAGTADVKHPVKQGMIQSFGTLVDTLIVCSFTAVAILSFYPDYASIVATGLTKAPLVQEVLNGTFGTDLAGMLMSIFLVVFAFTSLIGYYSMSESNVRFISDKKSTIFAVRVLVIAVAFVSCLAGVELMELICDTFMAFMGCVNMILVFLLSKLVYMAYDDWNRQKAEGIEEPVFHAEDLDDPRAENMTAWRREADPEPEEG